MKEPIFLALLFVFSLSAFAHAFSTMLGLPANKQIYFHEVTTDKSNELTKDITTTRTTFEYLSSNMNNLNKNERDTTCIPGKKPSTEHKTDNAKNNHTVSSIMDSLRGTEKIKYSNDSNTILVLGLSGAGKSTLTQYLFGNNSNLMAVAKRNNKCQATGDFYIEHTGEKIGHNPVLSHTEFPDLVIDPETNTTIYDCPGFSDTRDPEHDISGAYFIKTVSDNAKTMKFVFVVNYNSVTMGANREEFITLARHATNMINNIFKYNESIALVATKIKDDKTDEQRIDAITDFLQEIRQTLNETNKEPNVQSFIDILLTTSGPDQSYTRICFMPKFDREGRLIDLPTVQAHKKNMLSIIHNNIKFTKIDAVDVKPTISSNSVYYIDGLVSEVSQQMWILIQNVVQKVRVFYDDMIQNMLDIIHSFTDETIVVDQSKAELFSTQLNEGLNVISKVVNDIKSNTTLVELSENIMSSAMIMEVNLSQELVSNITTQHKYLKFLLSLHELQDPFHVNAVIQLFTNLEKQLTISKKRSHEEAIYVADQIEKKILSIDNNIMNVIQQNFSSITKTVVDIQKIFSLINSTRSELSKIRNLPNDPNVTHKCINQIRITVNHFNFTVTSIKSVNHILENTSKLVNYLNFLQTLKNQSANENSSKCTNRIDDVISYLDESSEWYHSLTRLKESLLECNTLKRFASYEISNIVPQNYINQRLEETNFKLFLRRVYSPEMYRLEYNYFKNIVFDSYKIESLKIISDFIFGYQFRNMHCLSNSLYINNNSSLLSDLYTTEGLINELLAIEYQFTELHDKISFKEIYESFLNRLTQYMNKTQKKSEHGEIIEEKALQYLYAIAASKNYRLNHNFDENSIELNIIQYFTIVEEHIREYDKALKEVKINEYAQKYGKKIDAAVAEANNFIENDLQSAIDESIEAINANIAKLIEEVIFKRKEIEDEVTNLEKTRSMLERQLGLKALFGTLQIVGAGLAVLGPVGAAVGSVAAIGGAVGSSFLPDPNGTLPVQLPASVGKNIPKITEYMKNSGKILEKKLDDAGHEIDNFMKNEDAKDLTNIRTKIKEGSLEIMQINSDNEEIQNANGPKKLKEVEKNVTRFVKEEQDKYDKKISTLKKEHEEMMKKNNLYSAESVDRLYDISKRIEKLEKNNEKMNKVGEELMELQKEKETIEEIHKSAKLQGSDLDKQKKNLLEDYQKEKNKGEINNPETVEKLSTIRKTLDEINLNHTEILSKHYNKKKIKYETCVRVLNNVQNLVGMGEVAFEVYSKYQNDKLKIEAVVEQINKANVKTEKINEYQRSIYETLIPSIQQIASISTETKLDDQSHAALDIKKWKIKDVITDIQNQVLDMTEGFNAQDQFKRTIDKVIYGIQTMIQMYDRIQDDIDRRKLANYIADISRNNKITNDPKINADIDKLEMVLKSNMVLQEYDRAMHAFKQYVFPYADSYLDEFSVMYEYNNLTDLIDQSRLQIKSLREKMVRLNISLHSESQSNIRVDLIGLSEQISSVDPYYTWTHELYKDQISKLLQGQETTLKANIERFDKRHAIMFNDIGIYFKMENSTMQAEFDKTISELNINMTHLGDSYYKCGKKTFIMSQPPQTFDHSVMPSINQKFKSGNVVYKILTENPAILSPFTMWKLNLFSISEFNFDQFTKYTNESIELRLVGTGRYVFPEPVQCNRNLEKYYKLGFTT